MSFTSAFLLTLSASTPTSFAVAFNSFNVNVSRKSAVNFLTLSTLEVTSSTVSSTTSFAILPALSATDLIASFVLSDIR